MKKQNTEKQDKNVHRKQKLSSTEDVKKYANSRRMTKKKKKKEENEK